MWQDDFDSFTPEQKRVVRQALVSLYMSNLISFSREIDDLCNRIDVPLDVIVTLPEYEKRFIKGDYDKTGIVQAILAYRKSDPAAQELVQFLVRFLQEEIDTNELVGEVSAAMGDSDHSHSHTSRLFNEVGAAFPDLREEIGLQLNRWRAERSRESRIAVVRTGKEPRR